MVKGILCETAEKYGWNNLDELDLLTIVTGDHDSAVVLRDYLSGNTCTVEGLLRLNIEGIGRSIVFGSLLLPTRLSHKVSQISVHQPITTVCMRRELSVLSAIGSLE